jgi:oxalate decarboxylase/phosphoglucose isomerase-like protein (cupin superfamily)
VNPFKFRLEQTQPFVDVTGGVARFAKKDVFPALDGLAIASLVLHAGGIRIPHWHPNAHEMDYVISGKAEITLFGPANQWNPEGVVEHFSLEPGEISFLPMGWFHSIKNVSDVELHILVIFNHASPEDIGPFVRTGRDASGGSLEGAGHLTGNGAGLQHEGAIHRAGQSGLIEPSRFTDLLPPKLPVRRRVPVGHPEVIRRLSQWQTNSPLSPMSWRR